MQDQTVLVTLMCGVRVAELPVVIGSVLQGKGMMQMPTGARPQTVQSAAR